VPHSPVLQTPDFQTLDVNIPWNQSVGESECYGGKDLEGDQNI